jgi:hypothetical protein
MLRLAFAFTHSGFRRTRRHGLVRENPNPDFAFTFHAARKRYPSCFNLNVGDPRALERLETELAEIDPKIARSRPFAATPLGLPVLHAFRHQWHVSFSLKIIR